VQNGLLLRSDLHTLFDLGLIAVSPSTLEVWVSPLLDGTEYVRFSGTPLRMPRLTSHAPSSAALADHWKTRAVR
jgi:hypothetical protein